MSRPRSAPHGRRQPSSSSTASTGVKGVRQLRRQRDSTTSASSSSKGGNPRVDAARAYLAKKVDPLMSEIINYLLLEQPSETDRAILMYLRGKQKGAAPRPSHPKSTQRNVGMRDRLYMARKVQPVLEHLMRGVVETQPEEVEAYFISQLTSMVGEEDCPSPTPASGGTNDVPVEGMTSQMTPSFEVKDMPRPACDALFRMLDETGQGRLDMASVGERIRKLHGYGVPIDSMAKTFWTRVEVDEDGEIDLDDFFDVMGRVAATATEWWSDLQAGKPVRLGKYLHPSREEVSYLFKMLDEHRLGVLEAETITRRMDALLSAGVPLRGSVRRRWLACGLAPGVKVGSDELYEHLASTAHNHHHVEAKPEAHNHHHVEQQAKPEEEEEQLAEPEQTHSHEPVAVTEEPSHRLGARVSVNYHNSGNFFTGRISKVLDSGKFDILYDDQDVESSVPRSRIRLLDAMGNEVLSEQADQQQQQQQQRQQQQRVEVGRRVEADYHGSGNWFAGRVAAVAGPAGGESYDVAYDDGDFEAGVELARIKALDETGNVLPVPGSAGSMEAQTRQLEQSVELKPVILLLGSARVGKSTLLATLSGQSDPKPVKTIGFSQKHIEYEVEGVSFRIHFFDVNGAWPKKWSEYISEVHGFVYVIDCAVDADGLSAQMETFSQTISTNETHMKRKPVLVLANKQDEDSACTAEEVSERLSLDNNFGHCAYTRGCISHPQRNGGEIDPRIEEGLDWLMGYVVKHYPELNGRVEEAKVQADIARKQAGENRNKRVMTKVLREKAFPLDGDATECFGVEDGLEFLAMEANVHDENKPNHGLPEIGVEVARLVGYQKVAMQMCGAMVCPVSKKKQPKPWEEVLEYVKDRREDAGLGRDG